jgi:hypothetical protein
MGLYSGWRWEGVAVRGSARLGIVQEREGRDGRGMGKEKLL